MRSRPVLPALLFLVVAAAPGFAVQPPLAAPTTTPASCTQAAAPFSGVLAPTDAPTLPAIDPAEPHEATTCTVDCDCPHDQVCDNGTCTIDFGPFPICRCDAECATGETCVNGSCETSSGCSVDCDCPHGYVCTSGACTVDFGPPPQCRCNAECPTGEYCINGLCDDGVH